MKKIIILIVVFLFIGLCFQPAFANIMENNPPYAPSNYYPCGEIEIPLVVNLSWDGGDPNPGDTVTYDVYLNDVKLATVGPYPWNQTRIEYGPVELEYSTTYFMMIGAWDNHGSYVVGYICFFTTGDNHPPYVPSDPIPEDGAEGVPNNDVNLSWTGGDPDGDDVRYDVYFDDVNPPVTMIASEQPNDYWEIEFYLSNCQTYYWRIDVYDSEFVTEGPIWSFTINCFPPSDPIIDGPCSGKKNQMYNFTFLSTDPDNDIVKYYVKWGDGTEEITGLYQNGTPAMLSHSWNTIGDKYIRAKAINVYGQESGWSTWTITITRNKLEDCDCQESPIVSSSKANTELKVIDIYVNKNFLKADSLRFIVRNTGDTPADGSYYVVIERLLFATLVIRTVYDYGGFVDTLEPGEEHSFKIDIFNFITPGFYINRPFTGFYMVHVYLYPNYPDEGFDHRNEKFFALGFGFLNWFQCY